MHVLCHAQQLNVVNVYMQCKLQPAYGSMVLFANRAADPKLPGDT